MKKLAISLALLVSLVWLSACGGQVDAEESAPAAPAAAAAAARW